MASYESFHHEVWGWAFCGSTSEPSAKVFSAKNVIFPQNHESFSLCLTKESTDYSYTRCGMGNGNEIAYYIILYCVRTLDPCRKHQVFESAALAATNPHVKEQASSKKQQQPPRNTGPSPTTTTLDGG